MKSSQNLDNTSSVKLMAVGDMMFGDCPNTFGFGVGSVIEKHGPLFPFEFCRDKLSEADIRFGNLESVLSEFDWSRTEFERMRLRGQPKAVQGLKSVEFNVLTLANNHIMQHGRRATIETANILKENGIAVSGLEIPEIDVTNTITLRVNGLKLGFLSYNDRPEQYHLDSRLDVPFELDRVEADIARMKPEIDCLILSVHWGDEYITYPSVEQVRIAHQLVDWGADLILGHHPHVLQGIEEYRSVPIVYSLGNFIFDMPGEEFQRSMIFECTITKQGIVDYRPIPVHINKGYQPVVLKIDQAEALAEIENRSALVGESRNHRTYSKDLQRLNRLYRKKELRMYLVNCFKYRRRHLLANLMGALRRRL